MAFTGRLQIYIGIPAGKSRKRQRMVLKPYPQAAGRRLLVLVAEATAHYRILNNVAVILLVKTVHISVRVYPVFVYVERTVQRRRICYRRYAGSASGNRSMTPVAGQLVYYVFLVGSLLNLIKPQLTVKSPVERTFARKRILHGAVYLIRRYIRQCAFT